MPDAQRDANIERLFNKMNRLEELIMSMNSKVASVDTKVDDFSARLKVLESREQQHIEMETKLETIVERMEQMGEKDQEIISTLERRVSELELTIESLKKAWKIITGVASCIGGAVGFLIKLALDLFNGGAS